MNLRPTIRLGSIGVAAWIASLHPGVAAPAILNHQGRIAVEGVNFGSPAPATGYFKFALVNEEANTTVWTNDDTNEGQPGGEPDAAVSVTVQNGLYVVGLGDTSIANMTALPVEAVASVNDLRLRIWFSTDNAAFELLTPEHRLVSTAYALNAASLSLPLGAVAGHVLTSDENGNASWQAPTGGIDTLASLDCEVGQVAVFNGEEWVCQDFPGFQWEPSAPQVDAIKIDISEGANFPAGAWTEVVEGGLTLQPPQSSVWENLEMTGPVLPITPTQTMRLTTRDFDVDELFGDDTLRIQGIEVRFPKQQAAPGAGATPKYQTFEPGSASYGNITITGYRGSRSRAVRDWVVGRYDGLDVRKDIRIRLRASPDDPAQISLILHDCQAVSWRVIGRRPGENGGSPTTGLETVVVRPDRIEMVTHRPKPAVKDWYEDMTESSGLTNKQRDLTLRFLEPGGDSRESVTYHKCFITQWTLLPLNKSEQGVLCEERIEVAVGYSDDFLGRP